MQAEELVCWGGVMCFRSQGEVRQSLEQLPSLTLHPGEEQEGPEETQVAITETEIRATCCNAF